MIRISQKNLEAAKDVASSMTNIETILPLGKSGFFVTRGTIHGYISWQTFKCNDETFEICWKSTS